MSETPSPEWKPSSCSQQGAPRVVLITGASSGLGAGLARAYAAPGRVLGLIGRNQERLAMVSAACQHAGATVHFAALDVGEPNALTAWLRAFDDASPIDLLIANAGITGGTQPDGQLEGMETACTILRTNLLGVLHTVEPVLPAMLGRRHGQIALIASIAAYRGLPDTPSYCASKAGVRLYGESLRPLLAPHGIRVSVVVPGFFASRMSDRFIGKKLFLMSEQQAIDRVVRGLQRHARRIVFPRRLALVSQLVDLLPAWLGDHAIRLTRYRIRANTA